MRWIICCVCLGATLFSYSTSASVYVAFRFDDVSAGSSWKFESAFIEVFHKHQIPVTLGVIPIHLDETPEKVAHLRGLRGPEVEFALHGWSHEKLFDSYSEFENLSVPEALRRLQLGIDVFEKYLGGRPRTFIPPWNSYNGNTLEALNRLGFVAMSASFPWKFDSKSGAAPVPRTCELSMVEDGIHGALVRGGDTFIVTMLHPYDFEETSSTQAYTSLPKLSALLDRLAPIKGVRYVTLSDLPKYLGAQAILDSYEANIYNQHEATGFRRIPIPFCGCSLAGLLGIGEFRVGLTSAHAWR